MALAYLVQAFGDDLGDLDLPVLRVRPKREMEVVLEMIRREVNCPATTSLGRLFDAASALAHVALRNTYEGQAPLEFEGIAQEGACPPGAGRDAYPYQLQAEAGMLVIDPAPLIRALVADVLAGVPAEVVSARFHNTVVAFLTEAGARVATEAGVGLVALSGGCFQNQLLTEGLAAILETRGFEVLTHSLVPANDGGIALGQAWVAANRLAGSGGSPRVKATRRAGGRR
jgi:hydrogenase maturation protein HypF